MQYSSETLPKGVFEDRDKGNFSTRNARFRGAVCKHLKLKWVSVGGTGNCFFESICLLLRAASIEEDLTARELRANVVEFFRSCSVSTEHLCERVITDIIAELNESLVCSTRAKINNLPVHGFKPSTIEEYLDAVANDGVWVQGNHWLRAISSLYRVRVAVVIYDQEIVRYVGEGEGPPIYLYKVDAATHWDALVPLVPDVPSLVDGADAPNPKPKPGEEDSCRVTGSSSSRSHSTPSRRAASSGGGGVASECTLHLPLELSQLRIRKYLSVVCEHLHCGVRRVARNGDSFFWALCDGGIKNQIDPDRVGLGDCSSTLRSDVVAFLSECSLNQHGDLGDRCKFEMEQQLNVPIVSSNKEFDGCVPTTLSEYLNLVANIGVWIEGYHWLRAVASLFQRCVVVVIHGHQHLHCFGNMHHPRIYLYKTDAAEKHFDALWAYAETLWPLPDAAHPQAEAAAVLAALNASPKHLNAQETKSGLVLRPRAPRSPPCSKASNSGTAIDRALTGFVAPRPTKARKSTKSSSSSSSSGSSFSSSSSDGGGSAPRKRGELYM